MYYGILGLLSAGGMGLWHGVEYYEKEKVVGEEFFQQWNNVSILQSSPGTAITTVQGLIPSSG